MLEIDISRNSHKRLGVLSGDFLRFGCPKDTQMPCWLRLCFSIYMQDRLFIPWLLSKASYIRRILVLGSSGHKLIIDEFLRAKDTLLFPKLLRNKLFGPYILEIAID